MSRDLHELLVRTGSPPRRDLDLGEVARRAHRRRLATAAAGVAAVVIAVAVAGVAVTGRDPGPEIIDRPPAAETPQVTSTGPTSMVTQVWERADVSMDPSFLADDGEVLVASNDALYASRGYDGGPVRRLDPATGQDRWVTPIGDTPFLLAADHRQVVAFDSFGPELVALDADDGSVLWRRPVPAGDPPRRGDAYAAARATLTDDGVLLVGLTADGEGAVDPPLLLRLDPATGDTQWTTALDDGLDLQHHAPVVVDHLAIVQTVLAHPDSADATPVYAIDVDTGQIVWQQADVPTRDTFNVDTVVVGVEGRVHLTHPGSGTITVDAATGEILWTDPALHHAALLDDGTLLAVRDEHLVRVDSVTGAPTSPATAGRPPNITRLSAGPVGVFAVADRYLAVVDPTDAQLHRTDITLAPASQLLHVGDVVVSRQEGAVIALRPDDAT